MPAADFRTAREPCASCDYRMMDLCGDPVCDEVLNLAISALISRDFELV